MEAEQEKQAETVGLAELGGEGGIGRWVERFYDAVARHRLLAPLFDELEVAREKQRAFFIEFFGGPKLYTETYGKPFLRFKHRHFKIGAAERDAWMELVMAALREEVAAEAILNEVAGRLGRLAELMVNHHEERRDSYYFNP
ncbi:MAG: globin [bacterium]